MDEPLRLCTAAFGNSADFSLDAYRQLFANQAFWTGLRNTFLVAVLSALVVTVIGTLLGWIIARSQLRIRHALDLVSVLSVGIPAVIAGLAVMLLYLTLPIGLYGTVWILVIAYSYRFATTTRLARAGFMQIHKELEEASATSGARWLATQRRVLVPLLLPALASGFILLFIVGVREFTIPLVLYSPTTSYCPCCFGRCFPPVSRHFRRRLPPSSSWS